MIHGLMQLNCTFVVSEISSIKKGRQIINLTAFLIKSKFNFYVEKVNPFALKLLNKV
jgi:uncharacterized protein YlxP (DUF503 family)